MEFEKVVVAVVEHNLKQVDAGEYYYNVAVEELVEVLVVVADVGDNIAVEEVVEEDNHHIVAAVVAEVDIHRIAVVVVEVAYMLRMDCLNQ
jgi:hypothetical protein